jgi:transcriptional regulator with XRE-family HTH domain
MEMEATLTLNKKLLGSNLRFLRKSSKLKLIDFSYKMNCSDSTVKYYERGNISLDALVKYKNEFGIGLDELCFTDLKNKNIKI